MNHFIQFLEEEDGIGVVELILILVVLIGLVLIFKDSLRKLVKEIFDTITKYLSEKRLSGATFPRHKSVIDFFVDTIELTKLGSQFKDICL